MGSAGLNEDEGDDDDDDEDHGITVEDDDKTKAGSGDGKPETEETARERRDKAKLAMKDKFNKKSALSRLDSRLLCSYDMDKNREPDYFDDIKAEADKQSKFNSVHDRSVNASFTVALSGGVRRR